MKDFELGNSMTDVFEMLPENRIKKVMLGTREIGVVRTGTKIYGFNAFCPHRGASLISGVITPGGEITCPLHHYRFDLSTGQCRSGDCMDLEVFPCKLSDAGLKITLP